MYELEQDLLKLTGMKAVSLQPSAGAQGELTGMLMIHAYHAHKGKQRKKVIMPSTAHGTNPASAAICGYTPVPVELNKDGIVTPESIREIMDEDTAGIMLTNPNTPYNDIKKVLESYGFTRQQGSVYFGDSKVDAVRCVLAVQDLAKKFSWFSASVEDI